MSQELADARACLMRLDTTLDEQINTLGAVPPSSKAMFSKPYVVTNKYIIRKDVEKARGGAGLLTFLFPCVGLFSICICSVFPFPKDVPHFD